MNAELSRLTNVTYLGTKGPKEAKVDTFSAIAYEKLAMQCGAPSSTAPWTTLCQASRNEDIIPLLLDRGGYGVIAMETMAEGLIEGPMKSFIRLVQQFDRNCPIQVIAAMKMKIRFVLMAQEGTSLHTVKTVISHAKSFGACAHNVQKLGVQTIESPSNGKAAQDVSLSDPALRMAALGPLEAAEKYNLTVLANDFQDQEAVTTFYMLGPKDHHIPYRPSRRGLSVFRIPDVPGALAKVVVAIADENINQSGIEKLYIGGGSYDFAIETESEIMNHSWHERAMSRSDKYMERAIHFGPFPVFSEQKE